MSDVNKKWVALETPYRFHFGSEGPLKNQGALFHIKPECDVERLPICVIDYADDVDDQTRKSAIDIAHLIAAAPELLEALIELEGAQYLNPERQEWRFAIIKAKAAIAKATGEGHE